MKFIKNIFIAFILFFILSVTLSGCCGHSSGGNNIQPAQKTTLADVAVNKDGSVSINANGISLNALPSTFLEGTKIKISKITGGDMLGLLGFGGKDISLSSPVFEIDISPEQEMLNKAATLTVDLSDGYDNKKKQYFALNRAIPTLVTTENLSKSLNSRLAVNDKKELGFITTFKYVALACLKTETLSKDPLIWCDNFQKDVFNDKYTSDVAIFSQVSTKNTIDKVFDGKASFKISIRTDGKNLTELSHKSSPISARKSVSNSSLSYGTIDLTQNSSIQIDAHTIQYDAFFNSNKKSYQNIPRRVVIESIFTNTDNIPISSQENVIYFRPSKRPYVLDTYPTNKSSISNIEQIKSLVVNFSEKMNTTTVEDSVSVTTQNKTYTKKSNDNKLTFEWENNNKKLKIKGNFSLSTASGTFNIKIAKTACSDSNTPIGSNAYSETPEDYSWSFNFIKNDFYVIMVSPEPGSRDVGICNPDNTRKGPDILLKFSQNYNPSTVNNTITLKSSDGKSIAIIPTPDIDKSEYKISIKNTLQYNSEYVLEVQSTVRNYDNSKTLGINYKATFRTKEPFASGSGTENDPYLITTFDELNNIRQSGYLNTGKFYKLANDIAYQDLSLSNHNSITEWQPIGDENLPFVGDFNGNNKTISDLKVVQHQSTYVGLFGYTVNSSIYNLTLESPGIIGHESSGSLVGCLAYSNLKNITLKNFDVDSSNEICGGLVGTSKGSTIDNCTLETDSLLFGTTDYCGTVAGILTNNSTLKNTTVRLNNKSELSGSDIVGGLVGYAENSKIINSKFYGVISASSNNVGGIVGQSSNSIIQKCSSLEGSASGSANIGGICGYLSDKSSITQCYSNLNLYALYNNAGGLVGSSYNSEVSNSYFSDSAIDGKADSNGGLIGYMNASSIDYCYTNADVSGLDAVGGLVGIAENNCSISNSAALNSNLSGSNKADTNKIIGKGDSKFLKSNCYSLSTTKIVFTGSDPTNPNTNYTHEKNANDGIEKSQTQDVFKNIILDPSIWNLNSNSVLPVLK